eukprot:350900_1
MAKDIMIKKNSSIISWNEGRNRILQIGIYPFFEEIDKCFYHVPYDTGLGSIPQQRYIATYDTIFTMCIQREPYNYSSQLGELTGEVLEEYYIKKMKKQTNIFQTNRQCLQEWSQLYQQCMLAINGMTRMFMSFDRFYVPSNDGLDSTVTKGLKLFFKHVFNIKFPLIKDKLIEQINLCRNDFIQRNYFYVDYTWLIMDCIVHLQSFKHKFQKCYEFESESLKLELLMFGYVRV